MNMNILVSLEGDSETVTSFILASFEAKSLYPEITIDFFTQTDAPSFLRKIFPEWIRLTTKFSDLKEKYSLIIQLIPDPNVATRIDSLEADARSGIITNPQLHIQGVWAQTYISMLGAERFSPFCLTDIFKNILIGDENTKNLPKQKIINKNGKVLIDVNHLKNDEEYTKLIQDIYTAYPGKVEEYSNDTNLQDTYIYLGQNSAIASLVCHFGGISFLLHKDDWNFKIIPSTTSNWNIPANIVLDFKHFNQMIKMSDFRISRAFRLTDEYLGNHFIPFSDSMIEDNFSLFDHIYYVSYNYINSLIDIDLPVPKISSSLALKNKGIVSVLNKLIHLNKFGIKFIQDYLAQECDVKSHQAKTELTKKLAEIDDLTHKTLETYPELDLLRLQIQFTKAKVPGDNFKTIAQNMILTFHEINQTILCIENLLSLVVNQHINTNVLTNK